MRKAAIESESYRESLLESLKNPDEAAEYLNACLEDDDARVFLLALRDVADARAASGPCRATPSSIGRASIACFPNPAIHRWTAWERF